MSTKTNPDEKISERIPESFEKPWFNSDVALRCSGERKLLYVNKQTLAVFSPVFNAMFFGEFQEKHKKVVDLECSYTAMVVILRVLHHVNRKFTNEGQQLYDAELYSKIYREADKYDISIIREMVKQQLPEIAKHQAYKVALELGLEKEKANILNSMQQTEVLSFLNQSSDAAFTKDDVRGLVRKFTSGVSDSIVRPHQADILDKNWCIPRNFDAAWKTSDAVLRTLDKKDLHVNKSVLASFSPYFHGIFFNNGIKHSKEVLEIDVEHSAMNKILQILHHVDRKFSRGGDELFDSGMLTSLYWAANKLGFGVIIDMVTQQLPLLKPVDGFQLAVQLDLPEQRSQILPKMTILEVTAFLKKSAVSTQKLFSPLDMLTTLEKLRTEVQLRTNCGSCNSTNPRTCGHNPSIFN